MKPVHKAGLGIYVPASAVPITLAAVGYVVNKSMKHAKRRKAIRVAQARVHERNERGEYEGPDKMQDMMIDFDLEKTIEMFRKEW